MLERLLAQSQDNDARVRMLAVRTLGYLGATTKAKPSLDTVKVVHNDLSDADFEIVPLKAHSETTSKELVEFWVLAEDPKPLARYFAVLKLNNLGDAAATQPVLKRLVILTQDADEAVRESALRTFGQLGQTAATLARWKGLGSISQLS